MTKAEFFAKVARKSGKSQASVATIIDEFMDAVMNSLEKGENVYLRGFGTFEVIERKEKPGRDIANNTSVVIPAQMIPKFKPCKEFKEMLK